MLGRDPTGVEIQGASRRRLETGSTMRASNFAAGTARAIGLDAGPSGVDDTKMLARSIVLGHHPVHAAIQGRKASRARPGKRQEVGIRNLTMPRKSDAAGERGRHAIDVVGPEFVAAHCRDVPQQRERRGRRNRV